MIFEQIYRQILRAYANIGSKNFAIKRSKMAILATQWSFERSLFLEYPTMHLFFCFKYSLILFCFFTCSLFADSKMLNLSVEAESAILINADTGVILFEKNSHVPHYPASITKIVTAMCALEAIGEDLDVMITADQDSIGTISEDQFRKSNYTLPAHLLIPSGCHIGIKKGEQLSLKDLLYGMMVASGDDAANIIAKYAGGTIPEFMKKMNLFASRLGCQSTLFLNPHGLHHPKQLTTAFDMSLIAKEALKNNTFKEIIKTVRYTRPKTNKQEATTLVQTNKLLRRGPYFYPKAIGVKTGYYSLAGSTLVAAAQDGDHVLIAVLMKAVDRKTMFLDAKKMFEAAFNQPKVQRVILNEGPQTFIKKLKEDNKRIKTYTKETVWLEYYPAEEQKIKYQLIWNEDLNLPVAQDQLVGELLLLFENNQIFRTIPLFSQEKIDLTFGYQIKRALTSLGGILAISFVLILALTLLFFRNRLNQ